VRAVSFVIPSYNSRSLLEKYLPSVLEEARRSGSEVVVVDDCSTDGTAAFLAERFPEVRLYALPANRGFAYAANYGVQQCRFGLVCVSNTDVELMPGFLEPLAGHFDDPQVFAVSSMQLPVDGAPPVYALPAAAMFGGILWYRYQRICGVPRKAVPVLFAQGAATVYDKEKFLALGGFDPMYRPIYWEDMDLCYRAWKRGWRSLYEPASTHRHYIMGTTGRMHKVFAKQVFHWKNRFLFVWRNITRPAWVWQQVLLLPVSLLALACAGKPEAVLGFFSALAQLPEVVARRLKRPAAGTRSDAEVLSSFSPRQVSRVPVRGKIEVLYLHEAVHIAGGENSLLNLVRMIDREKFSCCFVLPGTGELSSELEKLGIEVVCLPFPRIRSLSGVLRTVRALCGLIGRSNACIVHSNSIRTHLYGAVCARLCGIQSVWHQRNLLRGELLDPDRWLGFCADRIICNSRAIARRFMRAGKLPQKVSVVFNGVDTAVFNPSVDATILRQEWGIARDEFVVGIASRFNRQKGHETFLKAAQIVAGQAAALRLKPRFLVVGGAVFEEDIPRERQLRQLAAALGIGDKVIFAGYRRDMPQVYAAMDVFVLASDAEACGRVVLEAMACGKVIIATNSGGTPEAVADHENGLFFDFNDSAALAARILSVYGNPQDARRLSANARKAAQEKFAIQGYVARIEAIYRELMPSYG
jgi:glycosyltransferase involved in cell wall biosynthesis/GT2 family glycosyltransferase